MKIPPTGSERDLLLSEFGRHIGIENLSFDDSDRCTLRFGDADINFEYHEDRRDILIFSEVGLLRRNEDKDVLLKILYGNLASASLGTGTIGADKESGAVLWFDRISVQGVDLPYFQNRIQDALDWIRYWRRCLELPVETSSPSLSAGRLMRV